jgi:hypothetical protein
MMKTSVVTTLLISIMLAAVAQEYPKKEVDMEILADQLFGFQDLDLNYEELYENIALLLNNPINLNEAGAEELRFLNLMSENQVQSLLQYRNENGPLLSVYELQAIPEFDLTVIKTIIPFVVIDNAASKGSLWKRIKAEENNYLILRYDRTVEAKEGFNESPGSSKFQGDENKMYIRFRTSKSRDFSLGFTIEKDAGEKIDWNTNQRKYGFDFYSFHVQLQNKGRLKNIIIGDYQTQFGQGLQLGGSFGYGKGSEAVMTVRRSNLGILPYTSVNEAGYKRGAAMTFMLNKSFDISTFYSYTWRDATLVSDEREEAFVSSFQTTGLHRNENELSKRHTIQEQNYGAVLNFRKNRIDAGLIFTAIDFNIPVSPNPQPYNQFSFTGHNATNIGAFFNYTFHNFTIFSEAAQSLNEGYGFTAGLLGSIAPGLDMALHVRNYQRNFYSLYSNAFSETSLPQNESGVYWGWKYTLNKKWNTSGYVDLFRFPWLRYRSYAPSEGHEWLLRITFQPSKNVILYAQLREEVKAINTQDDQPNLYSTGNGTKQNYWVNCDFGLTQKLRLKTRAQFSRYEINRLTTTGMALVQDISYDLGKLALSGRYSLFDTDDYDNRQYVYERDVWLAYSMPAYSGIGIRSYILAEYAVNKKLTFWIRYARTRFTDRDEIGSGPDAITGNTKTDIRIQMKVQF